MKNEKLFALRVFFAFNTLFIRDYLYLCTLITDADERKERNPIADGRCRMDAAGDIQYLTDASCIPARGIASATGLHPPFVSSKGRRK